MNKVVYSMALLLLMGSSSIAQEVLTVDAVVQMVKAGFSEKIILQRVRSNPGHYGLTTQKMVELKRSGVPVSILSEMLEKDQQSQSQVEESKPSDNSCRGASRDWVTRSGRDSLTGASFVAAEKVESTGSGSCVRVTASCKLVKPKIGILNDFDARTLDFNFQYIPAANSGLSLLASAMTQTVTTYRNNPVGYVSPPSACVRMRVVVDDAVRERVASDRCNIQNVASVNFPAVSEIAAVASMSSPHSGGNTEVNGFVSQIFKQIADAADPTVATMQQVLRANLIRIELPFTDGSATVVDVQPQEPSFQRFVASCLSTFPDPAPVTSSPAPKHTDAPPPATSKPVEPPLPVDTFVSDTADTLAARTFEGPIEKFAAELPAYVERALVATHLPPRDYAKEIAFIVDKARTCLTVTPQMVAKTRVVRGTLMTGEWGPQYVECGRPDNGKPQWGQYATNVTDKLGAGGSDYSRRDLHMRINPIGGFASGQGIAVTVFFEFRRSDKPSFASNLDTDPTHRIVFAKVVP